MKKIAIVTRRVIAGGIEKALISMLETMDENKVEVTLFVMAKGGEFEKFIPSWVKIKCLYGEEKTTKEKIINRIKKLKIIDALKVGVYSIKAFNSKSGYEQEKILSKILPKQMEEFDLAIAYHVPASFPVIYVSDYIKAKTKVAWIHSDVEIYKNELELYIDYYKNFDKIYCVSEYGMMKFNAQYPDLKDKTEVFYNIINTEEIKILSEDKKSFEDNFDGIRILTVGRLTKEKGCDILPDIVANIIDKGFNIRWYLLGDGEERGYLIKSILEKNLEDRLILLGTKDNPYPFFKDCDIYVQPSRHEGYCITLGEAKRFNKPIITTNFVGAIEQIDNNETGLIVNFNKQEIIDKIIRVIEDRQLKLYMINNLKCIKYNSNSEINKIYSLL
ncbi:glycosyltransferase [Clostridium saudiense]|uniref:glycosyltransferase n=1 Tax=Clostridium saudiense TaxID=1414720 RepID=UPI0018AB926A|nr:glycosyltransferase [Clostridium saudiense]MEE0726489.1 glycosyltransferase [Clostridium saudiense]